MKKLVDADSCIWVTGASSGIGRALAALLVRQGYRVAVSARRQAQLQELAGELSSAPGRLCVVALDITDRKAVDAGLRKIETDLGPVGLAVLNAGTHREIMARDFNAERFGQLVALNIMGTVNCLDAVLPSMIARGKGHVAVVSSVAGYIGLPTSSGYGATKAALINMAEALKPELDGYGVKLQLVNPGFVKTPLTDLNSFPMPFLMPLDKAVEAFQAGLESNRFEIVFPRRLAYILKLVRLLPYPLALAVTRRLLPKERTAEVRA